jgi:hypothetical protein
LAPTGAEVARATTLSTVRLSAAKVTYGDEEAEHLSATVTPEYSSGTTPTGTVAMDVGSTTLCTATLSAGTGTCMPLRSKLPPGARDVVAKYSGDTNFTSSISSDRTLTVDKASSKTTLKLSAAKVTYGSEQTEHLSVVVAPRYAGVAPTGTLTLKVTIQLVGSLRSPD